MREVIISGMKAEGPQFFFKGLGLTLMRTFIVNAFALPTFELVNRRLLSIKLD
jgi:hypothetical protein